MSTHRGQRTHGKRSESRWALGFMAVFVLVLAAPGFAQARTRVPLLPSVTSLRHNLQVRPFVIEYTGDGSGVLGGFNGSGRGHYGRMHWLQWTSKQAIGRGAAWLDNCTPDCAAGTFHPFAVKVYATDPRGNVFRRLTLRYRYRGTEVVDRRYVVHSGRLWYYGVVAP
ncbi:MAG: hypothetical protein WAK93_05065 [Solirubrobacteraceae bacterium]